MVGLVPLLGCTQYDRIIADRFKRHPDAPIFESLPAAGPVFAPRLLAAFGSNRDRYSSAASVQKYGGIASSQSAAGSPPGCIGVIPVLRLYGSHSWNGPV